MFQATMKLVSKPYTKKLSSSQEWHTISLIKCLSESNVANLTFTTSGILFILMMLRLSSIMQMQTDMQFLHKKSRMKQLCSQNNGRMNLILYHLYPSKREGCHICLNKKARLVQSPDKEQPMRHWTSWRDHDKAKIPRSRAKPKLSHKRRQVSLISNLNSFNLTLKQSTKIKKRKMNKINDYSYSII